MSVTHTTDASEAEGRLVSRLVSRLAFMLGVMFVSGLVVVGIGSGLFGASVTNGVVAWLVCTISAMAAHVGGEYPKGSHNFAARMAIQMVVRTVIPFGVALWGVKFAKPPLETSLVFYILAFYLVGTLIDVQLHARRLRAMSIQAEQMN